MESGDQCRARLAELFDLPQEIILNAPSISLIGNLKLQVENHRGIIEYKTELIRIRIKRGQLIITGRELAIERLTEEEVTVTGEITDLSFEV